MFPVIVAHKLYRSYVISIQARSILPMNCMDDGWEIHGFSNDYDACLYATTLFVQHFQLMRVCACVCVRATAGKKSR